MNEVAELRRQVEDLTARVLMIEENFAVDCAEIRICGFTPSEARLLALLLKRPIMSRNAAHMMLYGAAPNDAPDDKVVEVHIWKIRRRLARLLKSGGAARDSLITTRHGSGWFIAPDAKFRIRKAIGLFP